MIKVNVEINNNSWNKRIKSPKKYFKNKLKNVVGLDIPFPKPYKSDLTIDSFGKNTPKEILKKIYSKIN